MEQMAELDNRFHHILYASCDSKMLENLLQDFHQYVIRIRRKTLSTKEKKPDEAEKYATQHMINAFDNIVKNGLYENFQ